MSDNPTLPDQIKQLDQIKKEISNLYQAFFLESAENYNKSGAKRARQALTALNKEAKKYKDITKSFKLISQRDLINATKN